MKTSTILLFPALTVAGSVPVVAFSDLGQEDLSFWPRSMAALAVVLIALLVGALLNFAVFAPAYWLLGRLNAEGAGVDRTGEHRS